MNARATAFESHAVPLSADTVRVERLLPGPVERLWSYLTDSKKRASWLAAGPMDLKAGGRYGHVFRNSELTAGDDPAPAKYAKEAGEVSMEGTLTACEPPRLLAYTWGGGSEVRFELEPLGSQVLLTVTHMRLASRDGMLSVSAGWHTHLGILADRLEGREPAGFWRTLTRLEADYEKIIPAS